MRKYKNIRVKALFKGEMVSFDSKKEYFRSRQLIQMEKEGGISDLQRQVPFVLIEKSKYGRSIKYVCDFAYYENGEYIVEDVKGFKTPEYKLKKRLLAEKKGIIVKET